MKVMMLFSVKSLGAVLTKGITMFLFAAGAPLTKAVFMKLNLLIMWCLIWLSFGCSNGTDGTLTILYTSDMLGNIEYCG